MDINVYAPCSCGSGRPYIECHATREVRAAIREAERQDFPGPPLLRTDLGDKTIRFVGNMMVTRPAGESLPAFTVHWLHWKFGEQWFAEQEARAKERRHIVFGWVQEYLDWNNAFLPSQNIDRSAPPVLPPSVVALLTFTSDLYTLILVDKLTSSLLKRLKDQTTYLDARYELAVAASLTRAGFQLEWVAKKGDDSAYLFDAVHQVSKEGIAVYARRRGTCDASCDTELAERELDLQTEVLDFYADALRRKPSDKPLVAFLDLYVKDPVSFEVEATPWHIEAGELVERGALIPEGALEVASLVVTNASANYELGHAGTQTQPYLWLWKKSGDSAFQRVHTAAAIKWALDRFETILSDD